MMRHAVFAVLAAVTPFPQTSRAQLSAERVVRFVVPEANALANSISLYGDTALLGTIDPEAYAFQLDRGDWWMHRLVLPSPDGFFMVVSLYEDVALIGVRPHAYIFRFDGSAWVHEGTLTDDRGDGDFGHTVDVDGSLAVVGTRSMDVQVFRFNGREWVLEARLAPPPRQDGGAPYGFADDVEVDGERVLVAKSSTIGDGFEGVYAFRRGGTGWYHEDTITLGETETVFQGDVALDGDVALIDADYDDVVHVFRFDGAEWKREAILEPPKLDNRACSCLPIPSGDRERCDGGTPNFGVSVALDGELALVGANLDDVAGTDSGAATCIATTEWSGITSSCCKASRGPPVAPISAVSWRSMTAEPWCDRVIAPTSFESSGRRDSVRSSVESPLEGYSVLAARRQQAVLTGAQPPSFVQKTVATHAIAAIQSRTRWIESSSLSPQRGGGRMLVRALIVGVAGGALTSWIAWSPLIPDSLTFHSVTLAVIGAIYVGFGLSDGRVSIAILELSVATAFLVLALLGIWLAPAFVAVGLILHGFWDLAHRPHGIRTKLPSWYPPFCAAFDFVFAGAFLVLARELSARVP